jgi:hypothetical protein
MARRDSTCAVSDRWSDDQLALLSVENEMEELAWIWLTLEMDVHPAAGLRIHSRTGRMSTSRCVCSPSFLCICHCRAIKAAPSSLLKLIPSQLSLVVSTNSLPSFHACVPALQTRVRLNRTCRQGHRVPYVSFVPIQGMNGCRNTTVTVL